MFICRWFNILIHDTDPERSELINAGYCGDCYKLIDDLAYNGAISVLTLPVTEAGLTIIKRNDDRRVRSFCHE